MSYCRWSECDVYAYASCEGGVRFWVAGDDSFNRLCGTYNEAYQYAKELRDKHGFDVPSHAIEALREDAIDEAARYQGPDSAVADMLADNAKLREIIADLEELLPESGRWYSHETVKAISEDNAKLRKLLLDVWNDAMQFDGFWNYVNDDGEIYNEDELPHYYDRMRELGLEVE